MTPLKRIGRAVHRSHPVRDYVMITAGAALTGWALDAFLIPNRLAAGGVSGLATVLHYVFLDQGLYVPVGLQMLLFNVVLLGIAVSRRGWRYGAKTLYGTVALSLAIDLLTPFTSNLAPDDRLLAVLYGGALTGIGIGFVFKAGGNTGGTDLVAQLLTRRVSLGVGQILLVADAIVMVTAALVFGPNLALYGFLAVFVTAAVIDVMQEGLSVQKAAYIISGRPEEVADAILHQLGRGATGLSARGLYTGEAREIIFTVVSRREIDDLKELVKAADPAAFMIISDVHEVLGLGFKEIGV